MRANKPLYVLLFFLILVPAQITRAQERNEPERLKYRMELVWMADKQEGPHEYVFVIGGVGFRTIKGLKRFISSLPAGSILEWAPGCRRMGDEPLLSSEEEMAAFKKFCEEHGVEFILIPSG